MIASKSHDLQELVQTCAAMGAAQVLEDLGIHPGEISLRQARDTYHKWFMDAYKQGRIHPWRVEAGVSGTKYFRVVDILALRASDLAKAEIIWKNSKHFTDNENYN